MFEYILIDQNKLIIKKGYLDMLNTFKNLILIVSASLLLIACGQQGGGAGSKKSKTIQQTKKAGFVKCGVSEGVPGFSNADTAGNWSGVDVDVCRAVAAAVLGDADKVKYTPLSAKERFTALIAGEIDILSRNTTWTLSRDADIGLSFVGVNFYDGQGFMVRKNSGITSTSQFQSGISACTNIGTTTELNMRDFFNSKGITYEPVAFEKAD
ncbi:MAG: general L-amino acid transport system substrate-binding protein, partial [Pelagibacterales bacterium]|nr:general L-amino acid transport system substrate-binding protein [Pelagibacterales bacterium]